MFSCFSKRFKSNSAENLEELHAIYKGGYHPTPDCEFVDRCINFSDFVEEATRHIDDINSFTSVRISMMQGKPSIQVSMDTCNDAQAQQRWRGVNPQEKFTNLFKDGFWSDLCDWRFI